MTDILFNFYCSKNEICSIMGYYYGQYNITCPIDDTLPLTQLFKLNDMIMLLGHVGRELKEFPKVIPYTIEDAVFSQDSLHIDARIQSIDFTGFFYRTISDFFSDRQDKDRYSIQLETLEKFTQLAPSVIQLHMDWVPVNNRKTYKISSFEL
jgi:hypothetical protein